MNEIMKCSEEILRVCNRLKENDLVETAKCKEQHKEK